MDGRCGASRQESFAEAADGVWRRAGTHDVPRWVEGVVEVAGFAVRSAPGRLHIAAEQ